MFTLEAMRKIKPKSDFPTMAVSKFLHFFNPTLFPIYDNEIVQGRVFRRFRQEFRDFCAVHRLSTGDGPTFLRNYMCWGSALLSEAGDRFMHGFVEWLHDELSPKQWRACEPTDLHALYATAFEFTIIGAAEAEGF